MTGYSSNELQHLATLLGIKPESQRAEFMREMQALAAIHAGMRSVEPAIRSSTARKALSRARDQAETLRETLLGKDGIAVAGLAYKKIGTLTDMLTTLRDGIEVALGKLEPDPGGAPTKDARWTAMLHLGDIWCKYYRTAPSARHNRDTDETAGLFYEFVTKALEPLGYLANNTGLARDVREVAEFMQRTHPELR